MDKDAQLSAEETARRKQRREAESRRDRYLHITTRILIYYFGFITLYVIANMIKNQRSLWDILLYVILPAIAVILIILIARKRGLIGGIIFITAGLACLIPLFYIYGADPSGLGAVFALLLFIFGCLPLIIVGILFILSWQIDKRLNEQQNLPPEY